MKLGGFAVERGVQFGTSGVRGLVSNFSPEVCYAFTEAFIRVCAATATEVVLAHDLRPSSPAIAAACAEAIRAAGKSVLFVGPLATPAAAYYASTRGAPAIVITGSHIPFDRNGIKFYHANGEISKQDELGMLDQRVTVRDHRELAPLPAVDESAAKAYLARYLAVIEAGALNGLRIGLYEHSSVARDLMRTMLARLGADVISLGRTDTFVPIDTEAVRTEDVELARTWSMEHRLDAIVSTDGDGDRPLVGDESGQWMRGDIVGILCAQALEADVVVTPVSSNSAVELCNSFSRVVRTRIGSPYVISAMHDAARQAPQGTVVVGYEANGGFLLSSTASIGVGHQQITALPTRDAALPILVLLSVASQRGCKLSELSASLPQRFTASDRLVDVSTEASWNLVHELSGSPTEVSRLMAPDAGSILQSDLLDGLRITFASGDVVHLRPSGNAPELRCYTESHSATRANVLLSECLGRVARRIKA